MDSGGYNHTPLSQSHLSGMRSVSFSRWFIRISDFSAQRAWSWLLCTTSKLREKAKHKGGLRKFCVDATLDLNCWNDVIWRLGQPNYVRRRFLPLRPTMFLFREKLEHGLPRLMHAMKLLSPDNPYPFAEGPRLSWPAHMAPPRPWFRISTSQHPQRAFWSRHNTLT